MRNSDHEQQPPERSIAMMSLELMNRFMATVDDQYHSPIADEIVSRWMLEPVDVRFFRASANFTCFAETPRRQGFLRFNLVQDRAYDFIYGEVAYIIRLANQGIKVAKPLPSLIGKWIEKVETALGTFNGVLFPVMPGIHLDLETLDLTGFGRWGRALGEVHQASEAQDIKGRLSWRDHIVQARKRLPLSETAVLEELQSLEEKLEQLPQDKAQYGMIHYDFELDNLCWHNDQPSIIDCDDCAYYWFVADIAYALRDLFEDHADHVNLTNERFRAFVTGYRAVRSMSENELQMIPMFLRLHNLVSMGRLYASLGSGPTADEPDWMIELRQKFHNKLAYYRASTRSF